MIPHSQGVSDRVGPAIFVSHKFVLTIRREAGRNCLIAAANTKQLKKDSPISNVTAAGVVIKGK